MSSKDLTLNTYILKDTIGDLTVCITQKEWVIEWSLVLTAPLIFMQVNICLRLSNHFDTGSSSNYQFDKGMSIWIGRVHTPIDQSLY